MSGVDLLDAIKAAAKRLRLGVAGPLIADQLDATYDAVTGLVVAGQAMLPKGVCLGNTNVSDSTEVPLLATMGELRAFAAALAAFGGSDV